MKYNDLTRRHFAAAQAGVLLGVNVYRGAAGSREQGTWVHFELRAAVSDGVNRLQAATFLAYACPHVIAVADWLAETAIGCELVARLPESVSGLRDRFDVPVAKLGRLLVIEDAWIAAASSPL